MKPQNVMPMLPLVLAFLLLGTVSRAAQPPALETAARDFLSTLAKEDYAAAVKNFDDTMTKVLPPEKLQAVWKQLVREARDLPKTGDDGDLQIESLHDRPGHLCVREGVSEGSSGLHRR